MISAKIVTDSISEAGVRLTTLQLCYPRFIHAEFMTHRVFSRNASSSRAIPVAKMIEQVRTNPAMPIHWGQNQPGMQANNEIQHVGNAKDLWKQAANHAADFAEKMNQIGLHKQVANRILEPFQHINVVVTATEWANFFDLRAHPDAQPEIHELAIQMQVAMGGSDPTLLLPGEWHLPYVNDTDHDICNHRYEELIKVSGARCARVTHLTHDGKTPDVAKDLELYAKLIESKPMHASPIEHQATPDVWATEWCDEYERPDLHGNFNGWIQFRKMVEVTL